MLVKSFHQTKKRNYFNGIQEQKLEVLRLKKKKEIKWLLQC